MGLHNSRRTFWPAVIKCYNASWPTSDRWVAILGQPLRIILDVKDQIKDESCQSKPIISRCTLSATSFYHFDDDMRPKQAVGVLVQDHNLMFGVTHCRSHISHALVRAQKLYVQSRGGL
ncbi:hypothetical protein HZ326_21429 [Fusarium oxysporum f. sp. albedinis]|nr:hypothetical protein HZ326_21429 [Fusarium oxysporum f. sp. albedinis]